MDELPSDVIFDIMMRCDMQSLGRMAVTCRKFRNILNDSDIIWARHSDESFAANRVSPQFVAKSNPLFDYKTLCQIGKRWRGGNCRMDYVALYQKCMPWIVLEQERVFLSRGVGLFGFFRENNGCVNSFTKHAIAFHLDEISKFATTSQEIITAGRDGYLMRWHKSSGGLISYTRMESDEFRCIDIVNCNNHSDVIVTGTNSFVKIWKSHDERITLLKEINLQNRVLSIKSIAAGNSFVVGSPGTRDIHPLKLFDLERGKCITNLGNEFRNGAGVIDLHVESRNTFLSCGYDTTIKLWDIRSPNQCVSSWMDPFDNTIYTVKSDDHFSIVSGAARTGLVHFFDKRQPSPFDLLFLGQCMGPVYSLDFDASHVFAACDRGLVLVAFHFAISGTVYGSSVFT